MFRLQDDDEKVLKRRKRQLNQDLNTCYLYLQSDYVLYDEYRSSEVIISRLAEHVKVANRIYGETPFAAGNGELFRGLNFRVRRIKVSFILLMLKYLSIFVRIERTWFVCFFVNKVS